MFDIKSRISCRIWQTPRGRWSQQRCRSGLFLISFHDFLTESAARHYQDDSKKSFNNYISHGYNIFVNLALHSQNTETLLRENRTIVGLKFPSSSIRDINDVLFIRFTLLIG